jgi:glycosyltransferase involved in cell wall biosynthesis
MRTIYIIFSTIDIGGAEKRFSGLWKSFQNDNESGLKVKLVMNPQLFNRLVESNEIGNNDENIVVVQLQGNDFKGYRNNIRAFIKNHTVPNDIIHFIGISPLLKVYKRKVLFTITNSNLNVLSKNNKRVILLSCFLANAIDILDPKLFIKICSIFFWKKKSISRTPNSFCNIELFKPVPFIEKKNWVVFLGRFEKVKQVEQIVEALPFVYESLIAKKQMEVQFFLLGYGSLAEKINSILNSDAYSSLPLTCKFEKNPENILNKSKVFLSLQLYNNYPSKSLLEAMASGNIPLVTDVGQSRWIAKPDFSFYIPEKFTKEHLADAVISIFSQNEDEWKQKMSAARQLVVKEHTIEKMKSYFHNIYKNL